VNRPTLSKSLACRYACDKLPYDLGMTTPIPIDLPVKPRVLIADDSRIVRATLIKHIEGLFDFREALNGEEAWETLLIDPTIRVVITDLTMPKLDGYGLLQRIRASKISRIREIPVVVVSGSDESEERARAKAAGANDLITKGIGTAQLLSRLDVLSKLVTPQRDFERGLEALVRNAPAEAVHSLPSPEIMRGEAQGLLAASIKHKRNFVVLDICIALAGTERDPPSDIVSAVGRLLQQTIRQTDYVAQTGAIRFTVATGSISLTAAHAFGERICKAIAAADLGKERSTSLVASCGVAALIGDGAEESATLAFMMESAHRRATLGMERGVTGVVGPKEESSFNAARIVQPQPEPPSEVPDVATLVNWIKEGRQAEVLPYIGRLPSDLQPLVDLLLKQSGHIK
jgi:two-component system, cell cycle response regulator